jgi:hypothetical protein
LSLSHDETYIGLKDRIVFIKNDNGQFRRVPIDEKIITYKERNNQKVILNGGEVDKNGEHILSETDILAMQIDPANVNIQDIRRYEKLMIGKAVLA